MSKLCVWSVGDSMTAPERSYDKMFSIRKFMKGDGGDVGTDVGQRNGVFKTLFCHLVWRDKQTYKRSVSSAGQWLRVDTSQLQIR